MMNLDIEKLGGRIAKRLNEIAREKSRLRENLEIIRKAAVIASDLGDQLGRPGDSREREDEAPIAKAN